MRFNFKEKIAKRISPPALIAYDLKRGWRGERKYRTARKYGPPIDFHHADHVHIYMTLRCCLNCYFCINRALAKDHKVAHFEEHWWHAWAFLVNRFYNVRELYFNGGEHFLFPGFVDFINSLDGFNINIFSNIPKSAVNEFPRLRKGNNNIVIKASYHPLEDPSLHEFIQRLKLIPKEIHVSPVVLEAEGIQSRMYLDAFRRCGLYGYRESLVYNKNQMELKSYPVKCKTNEHQIGPDMKMYRCLVHLVRGERAIPIEEYSFTHDWIECDFFPKCNTQSAYNQVRPL